MANNVIGQFKDELEQASGEVVSDVKDFVGEALEQGISNKQPTPQQIQQKQMQDQKDTIEVRRKIAFYQKTAQEQKEIRMQDKQKQMQKQQEEAQEKQVKKAEEIQTKQESKSRLSEATMRVAAEYKVGKGVGG